MSHLDLSLRFTYLAADFVNSTANGIYVNAAGQWLADPVAVLVGTADNTAVKALVKLSAPSLSDDKTTVTFQVRLLVACIRIVTHIAVLQHRCLLVSCLISSAVCYNVLYILQSFLSQCKTICFCSVTGVLLLPTSGGASAYLSKSRC